MQLLENKSLTVTVGASAILAFIIIAGLWSADTNTTTVNTAHTFKPTAISQAGPFDIRIVATATLDAKQSVILSSNLPSDRAKIIFLAPEGNYLEKGELVAKFDREPFQNDMQRFENELVEANAFLYQANAEYKLQEHSGHDKVKNMELQIELAEIKLNNLLEAEIPARIERSRQDASKARADYLRVEKALKTEEELFEQGFTKQTKVQEIRDRKLALLADLNLKEKNLDALENITIPAEHDKTRLDLENRKRELVVYKSIFEQKLEKQKASIMRMKGRITSLEQSVSQAGRYLEDTAIHATVSGILRYKVIALGNEKRKPQVGDSVWNRQGFAVIPDMSSMIAYVNIRESDVGKLEVGQTAIISPQAYTNLSLSGTVETVGALATDSDQLAGQNYFRVRIGLTDVDHRLRPGMTAKTSILAMHYENAIRVPVESIFYYELQPVCFLWRNGRPMLQPVVLGDSDGDYIVIEKGLDKDQEVMLIYPDNFEA